MKKNRIVALAATATVTALLVAGCSSGGGSSSPSSATGKVTLKFWSWAPGTDKLVAEWNKSHPDIQVKHTDAGGGDASSAKLLTASRAGNAPDLSAVEYTTLPSLIVAGVPVDLTKDVTAATKKNYAKGTLQQVTFDGHIYGLPQDVGPMALIYRSDILKKYDIAVPTTWDEFGAAAAKVKAADPSATLASLPPDQTGFFAGVATQAGAEWWSIKNGKWTVGIADKASLDVADFFQGLADKGYISTEPILTPAWNAEVNTDKVLSWPSALWAPGVISGVAPATVGKWTMAPLPQWKKGDSAVAYQGGSAVIVTKDSKHTKEAAEFAQWLNASKTGASNLLTISNVYPAAISGQQDATKTAPPALMPKQTDYYSTAAKISSNTIPVTWGPDYNVANTAFGDTLSKAIQDHTSWSQAFKDVQKTVVADMKKSGFKVTN
ncbi:sugar ABC transporter substrate-binding protein [Frondihabitans sucicola]|uniref:Sugar ABC transporter substrate-binding protein n=1 Tax=Frondihabitans sucicola TaxID=1268041 RepID=A0ABM8GMI7_9MICO|nr:extracellular solute-binding protein [Frondihabitans sucicola]BDZ49613.1 sugar ABC transporter substrate-binding protein [Frondihabitans sucicola]